MLLKQNQHWRNLLPAEDNARLDEILSKAAKHRSVYLMAPDVRAAQLWIAMLEVEKENDRLRKRVERLEFLLDGIVKRSKMIERDWDEVLEGHKRF